MRQGTGRETRYRDVRQGHRMGDKVQRRERGDKGSKTGTEEWVTWGREERL